MASLDHMRPHLKKHIRPRSIAVPDPRENPGLHASARCNLLTSAILEPLFRMRGCGSLTKKAGVPVCICVCVVCLGSGFCMTVDGFQIQTTSTPQL